MFDSLLRRRQNKAIPERFWNKLGIEARQKLLAREGFSGEHAQRLCATRWKKLSIAERAWLFSPLLLMERTLLELEMERPKEAGFSTRQGPHVK